MNNYDYSDNVAVGMLIWGRHVKTTRPRRDNEETSPTTTTTTPMTTTITTTIQTTRVEHVTSPSRRRTRQLWEPLFRRLLHLDVNHVLVPTDFVPERLEPSEEESLFEPRAAAYLEHQARKDHCRRVHCGLMSKMQTKTWRYPIGSCDEQGVQKNPVTATLQWRNALPQEFGKERERIVGQHFFSMYSMSPRMTAHKRAKCSGECSRTLSLKGRPQRYWQCRRIGSLTCPVRENKPVHPVLKTLAPP